VLPITPPVKEHALIVSHVEIELCEMYLFGLVRTERRHLRVARTTDIDLRIVTGIHRNLLWHQQPVEDFLYQFDMLTCLSSDHDAAVSIDNAQKAYQFKFSVKDE
jgi:hypothetical protein